MNDLTMKLKITDAATGQSAFVTLDDKQSYAEALHNHTKEFVSVPVVRMRLLLVGDKSSDLELKDIYRICGAIQAVFGDSLIWDITSDQPFPDDPQDVDGYLTLNTKEQWTRYKPNDEY